MSNNNIENLLAKSQRPLKKLDSKAKQAILAKVMQAAPTSEILAQPANKKWWSFFAMPKFYLAPAFVGAIIILIMIIVNWQIKQNNSKQLAQNVIHSNTNQPINKNINLNINQNINTNLNNNTNNINTNTNTNESSETALAYVPPPDDPNQPSSEFQPRIGAIYLDDIIGEKGGGGANPANWQFRGPQFSDYLPDPATVYEVEYLAPQRISGIANLFQVDLEALKTRSNNIPQNYTQNKNYTIYRCLDYRYDFLNMEKHWGKMEIDRCVSIFNGMLDMEQKQSASQNNGLDEAFYYINEITGYSNNQLFVQTLGHVSYLNEKDIEYNIHPMVNMTDGTIPYYPTPWHATLRDDKLVSLFGVPLIIKQTDEQIELISQQDAYERLVTNIVTSERTMVTHGGATFFTPREVDSSEADKLIEIENIRLEYQKMYTIGKTEQNTQNGSDHYLLPVYRVLGTEINSQAKFEAYVDPTEDGHLFENNGLSPI